MGYKYSENNYSLFSKKTSSSTIFVVIYVDDVIITGTYSVEIDNLKAFLNKRFKIKDIGRLHYFLGLQLLSQFMQAPRDTHLTAAFHLLRYLKKDPTQERFFSNNTDCSISAYCDSTGQPALTLRDLLLVPQESYWGTGVVKQVI
uniref:Reverse transcriptase Ty1/copia-type domain-containing protein n=1 Tax=Nicotiana tabacum TaxID=4097 RepID=A0A1S4CEZ5_TOBAC|nr:PREDICTED: uncharacterized protein LOC107818251 [Nicotiana tabacum]